MPETWVNFAFVAFVQLALFMCIARYKGKLSEGLRLYGIGILLGVAFGIPFDLIAGKYLGLYSYTLGFGLLFLIPNWIFLNGLFVANTLLMRDLRLPYFYLWTVALVAAHEIPNHFFRVWTWEFSLSPIPFPLVLSAGYFGGAAIAVFMWSKLFIIDR